jgi:hypothetical protein
MDWRYAIMAIRTVLAVLAIQFMLPIGAASQQAAEPADMQTYIAEIRQNGMSEIAKSSLLTIASIRNGYTELFFQPAPDGSYGMGYTNLLCKNPNADPALALREKETADMKNGVEMVRLKPLADADKSGFVTSAEAMQFRQLAEFGYKVAHVAAQEHNDMQETCKAMGMFEDALRQKLSDYRALQARISELGLAPLPEIALK